MNGENKQFMDNTAHYLANHTIIVPTCFSDKHLNRGLKNGNVYTFDLQAFDPGGDIDLQKPAVLLTQMSYRGAPVGHFTHGIQAMWLAGPLDCQTTSHLLPPIGTNYVFTESLGGCSVYIQGGKIYHASSGNVPQGLPLHQSLSEPYPGTAGKHTQTCAVAYRAGGGWNIGNSMPHNSFGYHKTHTSTQYRYLGN